jgi:hypothetical protein
MPDAHPRLDIFTLLIQHAPDADSASAGEPTPWSGAERISLLFAFVRAVMDSLGAMIPETFLDVSLTLT